MNPLRLRVSNYRTFRELDLELPAGCVAILGQNGAGKSSIVSAIDLALFGPEGRSWAPYLTVGGDETELMVELEFEHAGELYRVRRGYSARGNGKSTLDLEQIVEGGETTNGVIVDAWQALTLGSAKETQQRLEEILGFTRRTLRASSLLLQGDGAAFTEADPRDRKRILADTLGLDRFDQLRTAVRRDVRAAEQEIARIDGRLAGVTREQLDEELAQRRAAITALDTQERLATEALALHERELHEVATAVQTAREQQAARAAAAARVDAAAAKVAQVTQPQRDAVTAGEQAQTIRDELATLPTETQTDELEQQERDLVAALEEHRAAVQAREDAIRTRELRETEKRTIEAQASATKERVAAIDAKAVAIDGGELDTCPTCQQALGVDARTATLGALHAQAQALNDEAEALFERAAAIEIPDVPAELPQRARGLEDRLAFTRNAIRRNRDAELHRTRLEERLRTLDETIRRASTDEYREEVRAAEAELQAATDAAAEIPDPVDVTALEQKAITVRGQVERQRSLIVDAQTGRAREEERLANLEQRAAQLDQDLAARAEQQAELTLLQVLDRAYSPDGIPALIVENAAIPAIEVEANRILTLLEGTTGGCRLELRTHREKQTGGLRDDVLDVIVITEQGERAYETFSGGERTRLNLALRIALARLLATRRGAESRLLAIDEAEYLDDDGTAALAEVLRDLEARGVFDRILLVSHHAGLRDAFDQVLTVVKADGRSRVLELGALEVAA